MPRLRWNRRYLLLLRWSAVSLLSTATLVAIVALAHHRESRPIPAAGTSVSGVTSVLTREVQQDDVPIRFEDVTEHVGLDFRHFPAQRASLLPEDMGSGIACGDYDNDGFSDLFIVNFAGSVTPGAKIDPEQGRSRLYRNLAGERFVDVTTSAGIDFVGFGMGAAWGDYDNDGDLDLYVTAYGDNALFENRGDGTFRDVTAQSGTYDTRFSAGCSWADYDRDGHLDLYVTNYVDFQLRKADRHANQRQYGAEVPYTLNPSAYSPLPNALFHNNADGTFTECAAAVAVDDPTGRSLSASWTDFDLDGWPDLYVANDVSNNGVFRNRGHGTFEDVGAASLAADYRGAMGIAVADFDNDLDQDLLITHWIAQENALYQNMVDPAVSNASEPARVWFADVADRVGLGQISLDLIGWAAGFCDFDLDGRRDLWLVNGSTFENPDNHRQLLPQLPLILWNRGPDGFVDVAAHAARALASPRVGRGGARLDFNRDGLDDLVLLEHGGRATLLKNTSKRNGHWLRIDLRQSGGNCFAIGARIYVTAAGQTQMAEVGASSSYLSQDELPVTFGMGECTAVEALRIVWPDGAEETHMDLPIDQSLRFRHRARPTASINVQLITREVESVSKPLSEPRPLARIRRAPMSTVRKR